MIPFLAHFLFLLAAWTLVIKYIFPISFAITQGVPPTSYVLWDFWWVVHIWLGWSLLHWRRYTFLVALSVSMVEITIIVTKFVLFLSSPEWNIWWTNWFINKIFVLACFVLLFAFLVSNVKRLPGSSAAST